VKVSLAHVDHLLRVHDRGRPLDAIVAPAFTHALTPVRHARDCASCPVVAASPLLIRSAFQHTGALGARGIRLIDPELSLTDRVRLGGQLERAFAELLELDEPGLNDRAIEAGFQRMRALDRRLQEEAQEILRAIERGERRSAALVLCRPYLADPGLNHRVGEELQALGFAVLSIRSLPRDEALLAALFKEELRSGAIEDVFDIRDLHPDSSNSGGNERVWAARFAARHGRIGVVDLSSMKCAQDPPAAGAIRELFDRTSVVSCALHDLDETRPAASLRLRLRTFAQAMADRGLAP
jgi:predicted nucleotide-binding protein (sugar kinase/HSP70/actin superfamily)